jgi:hypothetical protein
VPLEYKGRSRNARVTLSKPLIRSRAATLQAEAYVGSMDADSSLIGGAPTRDALRIVGATLTYDFARQDQSTNLVRLNLEQGLAGLGAQGNSRANGSTTYTVAALDFTRTAPLASLGSGALSYSFAAQGQYSLGDPLLSAVESSFGGRQFGRSFDSGSMSGEQSLFGSFELRYALPLSLGFAEPVRFAVLRLHRRRPHPPAGRAPAAGSPRASRRLRWPRRPPRPAARHERPRRDHPPRLPARRRRPRRLSARQRLLRRPLLKFKTTLSWLPPLLLLAVSFRLPRSSWPRCSTPSAPSPIPPAPMSPEVPPP